MAILTQNIKPFMIQSLIDSMNGLQSQSWVAGGTYSLGQTMESAGNIYICYQAGTAGYAPPQTQGSVNDGTCKWLFVKAALSDAAINSNLYLGIGRTEAWPDETTPPAETGSDQESIDARNAIVALLELTSTNTRLGLATNAWTTGTVYNQYQGASDTVNMYITTPNGLIYKCLDNNNGAASSVMPTASGVQPQYTSDGYVWKYMGTSNSADNVQFGSASFVPVQSTVAQISPQWAVMQNAAAGEISTFTRPYTSSGTGQIATSKSSIYSYDLAGNSVSPASASTVTTVLDSGALQQAYTLSPGAGYGENTWAVIYDSSAVDGAAAATATVTSGALSAVAVTTVGTAYTNGVQAFVVGDGSGATVSVTLDQTLNTVNSIDVTEGGSGYTWAAIVFAPGQIAYITKAQMAPPNGNGADIVSELGASALLMSTSVTGTLAPYVPASFDFRQVSLIADAKPVSQYSTNNFAYIGPEHPDWNSGAYNTSDPYKYDPSTGYVVYLDNITAVSHTTSNEEVVKLSITF